MKKNIGLLTSVIICFALISCAGSAPETPATRSAEEMPPTIVSDRIPMVFDTDANNELDDQHAIAYMLFNSHVFDVKGITVNKTFNGGDIQKHWEEADRVVNLCGMAGKVPILKGANASYEEIKDSVNNPAFDGAEAVDFIIEQAHDQPVGKLTNIALALTKDPTIIPKVRIVWLGTNYPEPGEYNFDNDIPSIDPILGSDVEFEMVMVRYDRETGTDAVKAYLKDIREIMPGKGPHIAGEVIGRHGGSFNNFGDYSVSLFKNFREENSSRPLFDMAAVAIIKNPTWADRVEIPAPEFVEGAWLDQPDNPRKIIIWENFDKDAIMSDFYQSVEIYHLPEN